MVNQKTRDKAAWILVVVLVPVMIYLMIAGFRKVEQRRRTRGHTNQAAGSENSYSADILKSISRAKGWEDKRKAISREVLEKQKQIAASLPRHNPFSASSCVEHTASLSSTSLGGERQIRVTSIISRIQPAQSMAIINGTVFSEGERIEGWVIKAINKNNVILDNGTKRITVDVE